MLKPKTKRLIIDTAQFFEIEIPEHIDPDWYINTQECRDECADRIKSGFTDLNLERIEPDGTV